MKSIRSFSLFIIISFIIVSCGMEKSFIQKRKYNKGYYISIAKNNNSKNLSKTPSEDINGSKEIKSEQEVFHENEECISKKNENVLIQPETSKENEHQISNNVRESRTNKFNDIVTFNKTQPHKFKGIKNINKKLNNNTSSVRPNTSLDDDLINLILAIVLVIAIIMLLSFLDALLGGLLSLILLIVVVVLLLSYFDII